MDDNELQIEEFCIKCDKVVEITISNYPDGYVTRCKECGEIVDYEIRGDE